MHVRGSDKIRIAVNGAHYLHLSNRKGLYTNESIGISMRVSCYTVVTSLVSGRVKIRDRKAGRGLHCTMVKSECLLEEAGIYLADTQQPWCRARVSADTQICFGTEMGFKNRIFANFGFLSPIRRGNLEIPVHEAATVLLLISSAHTCSSFMRLRREGFPQEMQS